MPTRFDLPLLSDKNYASLQQELTAAIPQFSRNWTDFNYSDPGIALLQLLCWLGDLTLYRIDTIPRELYLNFLRWVVGASGPALPQLIARLARDYARDLDGKIIVLPPNSTIIMDPDRLALARYLAGLEAGASFDPVELRTKVVAYWQAPYRLVTAEDFATVARSVTANQSNLFAGYAIGRVVVQIDAAWIRVMPVLDYPWDWTIMSVPSQSSSTLPRLTLAASIVPSRIAQSARNYDAILKAVRAYLKPRALVGTPIAVERPVVTPLAIHVQFACLADRDRKTVATSCYAAIQALLSPFIGGPDGTGWPYGRPVTAYDVEAVVLDTDGVDRTQPVTAVVETISGLRVGRAVLGTMPATKRFGPQTYLGWPDQIGLPQLWQIFIDALDSTYGPIQIGVRRTLGFDTRLPLLEVWS